MLTHQEYYVLYKNMDFADPYAATFTKEDRKRLNMPEDITDYDMARYLSLEHECFQAVSSGTVAPEVALNAKFDILRYYIESKSRSEANKQARELASVIEEENGIS